MRILTNGHIFLRKCITITTFKLQFMKKNRLFIVLAALFTVVVVIFACQRENISQDEGLLLKSAYTETSCATECIEEGGPYFEQVTTQNFQANPFGSVTVTIWNTPTTIVYKITSSSHDLKKITLNGTNVYASNTVTPEPFLITVPVGTFGTDWNGCDAKAATIEVRRQNSNGTGAGVYLSFATSYNLVGVCQDCVEGFSYVTTDNKNVVFTYKSEVALTGAVVKFTCPHITGFVSNDGKIYTSNPGQGQGAPTVLTWKGDIPACVAVTFNISFTPDCGQNAAGFANVWTDFNVNDVSKKGSLQSIRYNCVP
jgi:hypothetical protein